MADERGPVIKQLLDNRPEITVFPVGIGLITAGAIIAVVALFLIGGSGKASFHGARGLPYLQGVTYFNDGKYEQAVVGLDNAIRFNTDDSEAYLYRGRAYAQLGQHLRAVEDYNRAIKIAPSTPARPSQTITLHAARVPMGTTATGDEY